VAIRGRTGGYTLGSNLKMKNIVAVILLGAVALHAHGQQLGVYDYVGNFSSAENLAYDEYFVNWTSPGNVTALLEASSARNRWAMLTVQPNSLSGRYSTLLTDITTGLYDSYINSLISQIKAADPLGVILRFGHEMEAPTNFGRYPWAVPTSQASQYIAAFKYVVTKFRAVKNLYVIWSPQGQSQCVDYYPGANYCEFVGCSLYDWTAAGWGTGTFVGDFNALYHVMYQFSKPVYIAEMGVISSENQAAFMQGMFQYASSYPLLKGIIYFNAVDSLVTDGLKPDWEVSPSLF
jgi:beta-mannanase